MESDLIIYTTEDRLAKIEVTLENETVWLSINQMAELFGRDRSVITRHISNVFEHFRAVCERWRKISEIGSRFRQIPESHDNHHICGVGASSSLVNKFELFIRSAATIRIGTAPPPLI